MLKNKKLIFIHFLLFTSIFIITPKEVKASVTDEKIGEAIEMLKASNADATVKMTDYVKAIDSNDYWAIANYINSDLVDRGITDVYDENLRIFANFDYTTNINGIKIVIANGNRAVDG